MPELPEIYNISEQLNNEIVGLKITQTVIHQEKSINFDIKTFKSLLINQEIKSVSSIGKWIIISFISSNQLLINLGMGGDLLYSQNIPKKKHQAIINFDNDFLLSFRFWWFGHIHFVKQGETHEMTKKLGVDLIRDKTTKEEFKKLFLNKKGSLKSFLLNQKNIAGIGNYYIHDILFNSRIKPSIKIPSLSSRKLGVLYNRIVEEFMDSISKRGAHYELDIYNNKGEFRADKVAYREGERCKCGTIIKKMKTGSTSSYYCPRCQK